MDESIPFDIPLSSLELTLGPGQPFRINDELHSDEYLRELAELDLECERQFGKYKFPNRILTEEPKPKSLEERNRELQGQIKELEVEVAFGKRKVQDLESRLKSGQEPCTSTSLEVQDGIAERDRHIAKLQQQLQEQAEEFASKQKELTNQLAEKDNELHEQLQKMNSALEQVKSLEEQVKRLQEQVEAKENKAGRDPDATQIVRFLQHNPIETAHRRSKGQENSMSSSASSGGAQSFGPTDCIECKGLQAKVKELQEEIHERRILIRRYMDVVEKITGFKVRLRDEELVKVVSMRNEKEEMLFNVVFQRPSIDAKIDLLECRGLEKHKALAARFGPSSVPLLMAHILIEQFEKEDGSTTMLQETATYCQTVDSTTQLFGK